jgi:hypothetical protein
VFEDRHRALKRWERARQLAGLEKDPVIRGPAARCRTSVPAGDLEAWVPVYIVQIFAQDLVCVKACEEPAPPGAPSAYWLVRGGIRWEEYLPLVARQYRLGMPVPESFRPLRKLGGELVARLEALPATSLPEVFGKLREAGLLPRLEPLSQANCPSCLTWDQMRSLFQDFTEGGPRSPEPAGGTQG